VSTTERDTAVALDARYGRSRSSKRRSAWIVGSVAAAFVVVFAAWLVWGGLLGTPAQLDVQDTGHVIVDDTRVQVRYELTVAPGTEVGCAVQALNSTFSIVGWRIVDIEASERRTRTLMTEVRTTELGVTGLIYRCWLT
jgi:hypothetical protein